MPERRGLHHVEEVMGTVVSFDVRDEPTPAIEAALREAVAWLHRVDAVFSTYRPDSQVSRLNRGEAEPADCDPEVAEVLELCERAARATRGCFSHRAGGRLDPSGMVKGWAVEHASRLLLAAGAHNHSVNGGGDVQLCWEAAPGTPWRVGIAHPFRPRELTTMVSGRDIAVATSGTAERGAHIIDPRTGRPAAELASITLVGRRLTDVDAYATAAFVMGNAARSWVERLDGFEAFAVTADARAWWTSGFARYGLVPVSQGAGG